MLLFPRHAARARRLCSPPRSWPAVEATRVQVVVKSQRKRAETVQKMLWNLKPHEVSKAELDSFGFPYQESCKAENDEFGFNLRPMSVFCAHAPSVANVQSHHSGDAIPTNPAKWMLYKKEQVISSWPHGELFWTWHGSMVQKMRKHGSSWWDPMLIEQQERFAVEALVCCN